MKFRFSWLAVICWLAIPTLAVAQRQAEKPLTRAELGASLAKVERLLADALKLRPTKPQAPSLSGSASASRLEVVRGLFRLHSITKPAHAFLPGPTAFDAGRVKKLGNASAQRELLELLRWGYLAPVGPVSAGPAETLTLEDWGDALGYFLSRVAELTHTPSARFSPALMSDGGLSNVRRSSKP